MGFEDSPAPKSSSLFRQLILGVILVLIAGAAVYEFKYVRPEVAEYQQKVVDNDNGFLGPADIQELMEREPAHKEEYEDGSLVETYSWQRPIPYMTHDLFAIYKKTVRNHENGEVQTDFTFTKITNSLDGVELPGTQTFLIPELKQDGGMSTGFGGGGGGGRGRGQNNRAENNQQDEKESDDKADSTDKKESDENKSSDQSTEKADTKKSDTKKSNAEKSDADKKAGDGSSKESEKTGEAGKSDEATKSSGAGDPESAGKTAEKNNEAEKDESTKKDESEKKPDPAK
jgi:hypothetical protein